MTNPENPRDMRAYGEYLKSHPEYNSLAMLINVLLGEDGCPWDRERTLGDCPAYIKSELDEVIEALESGDRENLEEELGDLLFMVVFTMKVAQKEGLVEIEQVFKKILDKMVFRHPHVFGGDTNSITPDEVVDNWQRLKKQEKNLANQQDKE